MMLYHTPWFGDRVSAVTGQRYQLANNSYLQVSSAGMGQAGCCARCMQRAPGSSS